MAHFKRAGFIVILVISAVFVYLSYDLEKKSPSPVPLLPIPTIQIETPSPTPVPVTETKTSVFVPYWALGKGISINSTADSLYYFGIAVDKNGVVTDDAGYKNLAYFDCPKGKTCILVIRMLSPEDNLYVLQHPGKQSEIINTLVGIADRHSFKGLALDLEQSTLLHDDAFSDSLTQFVQLCYTFSVQHYKTFSFIVYGDTYYRKRPYDLKKIADSASEVMVMAYDFSKNYGEPGPNFPFDKIAEENSYDFKDMVTDFSKDVPPGKLTVIFGMYGYDWTLNAQGTPLKRATAITDREIEKLLKNGQSQLTVLPVSKEKKVTYEDATGRHVVWYEDEESAGVKTEYLEKQGIGSVSFWAYGYY